MKYKKRDRVRLIRVNEGDNEGDPDELMVGMEGEVITVDALRNENERAYGVHFAAENWAHWFAGDQLELVESSEKGTSSG
jgi:hypothetical protein